MSQPYFHNRESIAKDHEGRPEHHDNRASIAKDMENRADRAKDHEGRSALTREARDRHRGLK